jgi:hypothetical protein
MEIQGTQDKLNSVEQEEEILRTDTYPTLMKIM